MPTAAQRRKAIDQKGAANTAARRRKAAQRKKIDAIRKKLKVANLRRGPGKPYTRAQISGQLRRANALQSGKSRMAIYEDDDGVKLDITRIEAGKEADLPETISAIIERFSKNQQRADAAQLMQVFTALDDLSNLDAVGKAMEKLDDPRIRMKAPFDRDQEIQKFKRYKGIAEIDPASQQSHIRELKNFLTQESGNRSNKAYQEIMTLLDQAIREDEAIEKDPDRRQSDIGRLFAISNQIAALMDEAASNNGNSAKAEKRNLALKNSKVMLDHYMMSKTWASGVMSINDQKMVASAKDMEAIKAKMEQMKAKGIELTPNQAWAVVAAKKKATAETDKFKKATAERLVRLNQDWGTDYTMADIETLKNYLPQLKIATNYYLDRAPGDNTGSQAGHDKTLGDLLLESDSFKNVWETGESQASKDFARRGAVEESMGYAQALNRTEGRFQDIIDDSSRFDVRAREELPKYAALVSGHKKNGVADRYGHSVIYWKNANVNERMTHTPGDSWSGTRQGVKQYTHPDEPYAVFADAESVLMRFLLAEATGKDRDWYQREKEKGAELGGYSYIETQIHGNLDWNDAEKIVVGFDPVNGKDEQWARDYAQQLDRLKSEKGYTFEIAIRDTSGNIQPYHSAEPVYDKIPELRPENDYAEGLPERLYDKVPELQEDPYGVVPPERVYDQVPELAERPYDSVPPLKDGQQASDYSKLPPPQQLADAASRASTSGTGSQSTLSDMSLVGSGEPTHPAPSSAMAEPAGGQTREQFIAELVQGIDHAAAANPSLKEVLDVIRSGGSGNGE